MDRLRGGIIGFGGIGKEHGAWMEKTGQVRVEAVCDSNQELAGPVAERFNDARFYCQADRFFDSEELDLVSIALPHNLHAPFAIRCLQNGWNVVVEKPMATGYAEAKAMIEAAHRSGKMLTVFHNRRLDGWFLAARSVIDRGLLGKVFEVNMARERWGRRASWRGEKQASGGLMFDWGAHLVDWALHLVDPEVRSVSGFLYRRQDDPEKNEDHGRLQIRFADGALANIVISWANHFGDPWRYKILGDRGSLMDRWQWEEDGKLSVITLAQEGDRTEMSVPYVRSDVQQFYDNVVAHIRDGEPLMVSPQSAAKVVNILECAELSDRQGGRPLALQQ